MRFINIFFISLFLNNCTKGTDYVGIINENELINYQKEFILKKDEQDILFATNIKFGKDGEFIFFDPQMFRINIFEKDGRFKLELGKYGNGPNEFVSIYGYGIINGNYLIYDAARDILRYYNNMGALIKEDLGIVNNKYSTRSSFVHDSKYGPIMVLVELDKMPYNLHESAVLFTVDGKRKFGKYPKALIQLGVRDITPFVVIDDNIAYIMYSELGLIEKWDLNSNILIKAIYIKREYNADNERMTLNIVQNADEYNEHKKKHSIISHSFINDDILYIIVYNYKNNLLEINMYKYMKKELTLSSIVKLNYSIAGIIGDDVISIHYDKNKLKYIYRYGRLIKE